MRWLSHDSVGGLEAVEQTSAERRLDQFDASLVERRRAANPQLYRRLSQGQGWAGAFVTRGFEEQRGEIAYLHASEPPIFGSTVTAITTRQDAADGARHCSMLATAIGSSDNDGLAMEDGSGAGGGSTLGSVNRVPGLQSREEDAV